MAAGTATVTYDNGHGGQNTPDGSIRRVIVAWTSGSAGESIAASVDKLSGSLIKGVTVPSAVAVPSDNYDIVITDSEGANVLGNSVADLQNRDDADTEVVYFETTIGVGLYSIHPVVCSTLTVTVSSAGNSKSGTLYLYYRS